MNPTDPERSARLAERAEAVSAPPLPACDDPLQRVRAATAARAAAKAAWQRAITDAFNAGHRAAKLAK